MANSMVTTLTKNSDSEEEKSQLVPELVQLSLVDDLEPIKQYVEYVDDFQASLTGNPDYKFRIKDLREVMEGESWLKGKTFLLPGYDVLTQITCYVRFERFQLSIVFLNPEMNGQPVKWRINPRIALLMTQNGSSTSEGKWFHHKFKHDNDIVYGKPYNILDLNYKEEIEKRAHQNSITLHLFVEKSDPSSDVHVSDGLFLWKIDVTEWKLDEDCVEMRDVAVSPYFYTEPEGLRVKIVFYFKENWLRAEVRFLDEKEFNHKECKVSVCITNAGGPDEPKNSENSFFRQQPQRLKCHTWVWLAYLPQIPTLAYNNKLMVKVAMQYT